MAYRAVFHGGSSPEQRQEITEKITRFRAENAVKLLRDLGFTNEGIRACIEREMQARKTGN